MRKYLLIKNIIEESIKTERIILEDNNTLLTISKVIQEIIRTFKKNRKILLCGNGGSAADAQHIAAEFLGKFYLNRKPLFAEALHTNTSFLTAVANDFSYNEVFARAVAAMGRKGDILIAISTSGNSANVIKAIKMANKMGILTIGLTGKTGGKMKSVCKYLIKVPSINTPRIQESHILIGHIICGIAEKKIFRNKTNKI